MMKYGSICNLFGLVHDMKAEDAKQVWLRGKASVFEALLVFIFGETDQDKLDVRRAVATHLSAAKQDMIPDSFVHPFLLARARDIVRFR